MKRKRRRGNGEGTVFEDKKNKRWIGQYISEHLQREKPLENQYMGKLKKKS